MFSVFINKKEKKMLKVPQSPWLFCYTHPTEKKSTRKRAEEDKRNREQSQVQMGAIFSVPYVVRVTERKSLFFLPEKEWEEIGGGKG